MGVMVVLEKTLEQKTCEMKENQVKKVNEDVSNDGEDVKKIIKT